MLEYIKNLDAILADLERADITIARTNSRFYYFSIKIIDYICNFEE